MREQEKTSGCKHTQREKIQTKEIIKIVPKWPKSQRHAENVIFDVG